jgi:hypothetical protein
MCPAPDESVVRSREERDGSARHPLSYAAGIPRAATGNDASFSVVILCRVSTREELRSLLQFRLESPPPA